MRVVRRGATAALILIAVGVASLVPAFGQEKVVHIATTDWPPYTQQNLPAGGASSKVVRAAFEKMGYGVEVSFLSWKRAIQLAAKGTDNAIAYFPGYHCRHRSGFEPSEPIGYGPLGFAENIEAPITWKTLDDLGEQRLKIGTVLGYANTDEFDSKVGSGWIITIPSDDDIANLKKLLRKRIDAAVVDKLTLEYLKATDPVLKEGADKLMFDETPLEEKTLNLCFRADDEGRLLKHLFNAGLEQIAVDSITDDYFATAFGDQ